MPLARERGDEDRFVYSIDQRLGGHLADHLRMD